VDGVRNRVLVRSGFASRLWARSVASTGASPSTPSRWRSRAPAPSSLCVAARTGSEMEIASSATRCRSAIWERTTSIVSTSADRSSTTFVVWRRSAGHQLRSSRCADPELDGDAWADEKLSVGVEAASLPRRSCQVRSLGPERIGHPERSRWQCSGSAAPAISHGAELAACGAPLGVRWRRLDRPPWCARMKVMASSVHNPARRNIRDVGDEERAVARVGVGLLDRRTWVRLEKRLNLYVQVPQQFVGALDASKPSRQRRFVCQGPAEDIAARPYDERA
jgi:hypothetical protein